MSKIKKAIVITLAILIVGTLAFIWGNSVATREKSEEVSSGVYEVVSPVFDAVVGENKVTEKDFRKMAHFSEFFALGLEIELLVFVLKGLNIKWFLIPLPFGLFAGGIDEIIQIFSERGAAITDVLIDFSGYLLAFLIFAVAYLIGRGKKKRQKKS